MKVQHFRELDMHSLLANFDQPYLCFHRSAFVKPESFAQVLGNLGGLLVKCLVKINCISSFKVQHGYIICLWLKFINSTVRFDERHRP